MARGQELTTNILLQKNFISFTVKPLLLHSCVDLL